MKIVDRQTFLAMPAGTLFSKWQPCVFEDVQIKGVTLFNGERAIDFSLQQIADAVASNDSGEWSDIQCASVDCGSSFALDFECESRDGFFDADQMFAIWERADVEGLLARLRLALSEGYGPQPTYPA
jgi:hypothetical protein